MSEKKNSLPVEYTLCEKFQKIIFDGVAEEEKYEAAEEIDSGNEE